MGTRLPSGNNKIEWIIVDDYGNKTYCETNIHVYVDYAIPSALSPNGDGINDTWEITFLNLYPEVSVFVFDRPGRILFNSKPGYPENWNRKYQGNYLPVDSYYYIIRLKENQERHIKGTVTIIY